MQTIRSETRVTIDGSLRTYRLNDVRSYVGRVFPEDGGPSRPETYDESEEGARVRGFRFRHQYTPIWASEEAAVLCADPAGREPRPTIALQVGEIFRYETADGKVTTCRVDYIRTWGATIVPLEGPFAGEGW